MAGSAGEAPQLTDEQARLVAAARAFVGDTVGAPKRGRDPVNQPMINHWVQAFGDEHPAYVDGDAVPPAMLQAWTMDAVTSDPDGPQTQVLGRLNEAGFTGVVATNYDHEYVRPLQLGEIVTQRTSVETLSDPKATGLGVGLFLTLRNDYLVDDELVGIGRMKLLKFAPRAAAAPVAATAPGAKRPTPAVNRDNAFWWEAVERDELLIQRCAACSTLRHPPRPMCGACQSTAWDTIVSAGRGTVYSFVVHHHPPLPGIDPPHGVVLVELDEGTRLLTHLVDTDPADIRIGMAVEVAFTQVHDELRLPLFRPVAEATA